MSKRNSSGSANTLFNYFVKSPTPNKSQKIMIPIDTNKDSKSDVSSPKPALNENVKRKKPETCVTNGDSDGESDIEMKSNKKSKFVNDDVDDDDITVVPKRKRIRIMSENSDEENVVSKEETSVKNKLESFKFVPRASSSPAPRQAQPTSSPAPKTKKQSKLDESKSENDSEKLSDSNDSNNWVHCRLDWLKPEDIRDANKRRPDHPDYNPRTLFVPEDFKKKQTPAHKQWWEIKSAHYDCVLFFKVGKFYELYHMDAAVGVNELGFSYMKGDFAHSGFPESAYTRMASSLVQKGYKVARVEQTETPDMMQQRTKKLPGKEKVVKREICQVTCKGAEVLGLVDNGPAEATASFMIAIAEQDTGAGRSCYGVCFIDTSIGQFHLGQFDDDKHSSRLLTTLAHHPPALVLTEKSNLSQRTSKILRITCQTARREMLTPRKEFWTAENTLKVLSKNYSGEGSTNKWPGDLESMLSDTDMLGLTPKENYSLAIKALGACIWYLSDCLLDIQVMEMARFNEYHPPDVNVAPKDVKVNSMPSNMVLDASTLLNLHLTGNTSLYSKLNQCTTPMGKRLLLQWVCSPSCNVEVIKERQKAISFLLENQSMVQDVRAVLNGLPDMERLFAKIHTLGNLNRSQNHPDSRAILYEMKTYSKRKVIDFISILNGFQSAMNVMKRFQDTESTLLKRITQLAPEGQYPDYADILKFFKGAFDHTWAEKEGTILPEKGVDTEYDSANQEIEEIKNELAVYLKTQEKQFQCKIEYFGTDKKRYQLEVPESKQNKAGHGYHLEGAKKGYKRYSTSETKEFLSRMLAAEDHVTEVLKDLSRRIFEKFSQSHNLWQKAIQCIATLDVLIALAEYTRLQSCEMCIPQFVSPTDEIKPFISIKDGRHPCIGSSESDGLDDYIPNDTELGAQSMASLVLLTGPNMGGKSTLMRQLGLLTIMAQIGCHIPAAECSLTVVDRIFTRLGAHDDIMTGQSTFLVELSETAAILKHATPHSLILLDELGRGTSTYDGTAIAAAVLDDLCNRSCRTIFSTHYHTLVEDFKSNPGVALAHMACMVETEEGESDDADNVTQETVTFMYKLAPGACPKSYGFNAARLAGISKGITRRAHQIAIEMEKEANLVALFKKIFTSSLEQSNYKELINTCKLMEV